MVIEEKDVINVGTKDYIALATTVYNNVNYAFMNTLENEEPTEEYFIFYTDDNGELQALKDKDIMDELIKIFQKKIKDNIELFLSEDND